MDASSGVLVLGGVGVGGGGVGVGVGVNDDDADDEDCFISADAYRKCCPISTDTPRKGIAGSEAPQAKVRQPRR